MRKKNEINLTLELGEMFKEIQSNRRDYFIGLVKSSMISAAAEREEKLSAAHEAAVRRHNEILENYGKKMGIKGIAASFAEIAADIPSNAVLALFTAALGAPEPIENKLIEEICQKCQV